jgi:antitoxin (DNA-binding transcriptional repressor) of toxin-antitoxin stability system
MWTDIRPSSRDYKIGKMQASWYKLVIRHAQPRTSKSQEFFDQTHLCCYNNYYGNVTRVIIMSSQVSKSQFKATALEILRSIESTGDSVIVTDHGKPTIEVRPYREIERSPLEVLKGSVAEFDEPTKPVGENDWEALA